jgi:hypothetical protein
MPELSDSDWQQLARDLSNRVAAVAPEWTNRSDNDPGITVVELFGFLAESLLARPGGSPRARTKLRDVLTLLAGHHASACSELSTPTRVRYSSGQILSPADFEQEQDYARTRRRRHNLLLHGTGIVSGLAVSLEPQPNGELLAVVSPGVGIGPDGEELVVCERLTTKLPSGASSYVTLHLAERESAIQAGGQASRIEELTEAAIHSSVPPGHLALARIERVDGSWVVDAAFKPVRLPG